MQLNSDFSQKVLIHDRDNPWQTSPAIGVERKMLDRIVLQRLYALRHRVLLNPTHITEARSTLF